MDDMEYIRLQLKKKKQKSSAPIKKIQKSWWVRPVSYFLVTVLVTLVTLIVLKGSPKAKTWFYNHVYNTNFSFASINNWYEKTFGSPIPFQDIIKKADTKTVFQEKLTYSKKEKYEEGAKLQVAENYLVPSIESGMVVYIGEKEGYGNTVIIQQINGVDVWYGNMKNNNVKLYDYVEKGSLVGEAKDKILYLVFKKEGNALSYEDYL